MDEKRKKKWAKYRKLGRFWFSCFNALVFSLLAISITYVLYWMVDGMPTTYESLISKKWFFGFLICFIGWFAFSFYNWSNTEKEYLKSFEK